MDARPSLTGDQIWCIRRALGETQGEFAKRIFFSQVGVFHLENKGDKEVKPRVAHDIIRIAEENGIEVPSADKANEARNAEKTEKADAA